MGDTGLERTSISSGKPQIPKDGGAVSGALKDAAMTGEPEGIDLVMAAWSRLPTAIRAAIERGESDRHYLELCLQAIRRQKTEQRHRVEQLFEIVLHRRGGQQQHEALVDLADELPRLRRAVAQVVRLVDDDESAFRSSEAGSFRPDCDFLRRSIGVPDA